MENLNAPTKIVVAFADERAIWIVENAGQKFFAKPSQMFAKFIKIPGVLAKQCVLEQSFNWTGLVRGAAFVRTPALTDCGKFFYCFAR